MTAAELAAWKNVVCCASISTLILSLSLRFHFPFSDHCATACGLEGGRPNVNAKCLLDEQMSYVGEWRLTPPEVDAF